jgi:hypothetical protein
MPRGQLERRAELTSKTTKGLKQACRGTSEVTKQLTVNRMKCAQGS